MKMRNISRVSSNVNAKVQVEDPQVDQDVDDDLPF
jgi:hypothetical protein